MRGARHGNCHCVMPAIIARCRFPTSISSAQPPLDSQHGEPATAKAREKVEETRRKGDAEGADAWLRIIAAIGALGMPPTDAKH